MDLPPLFGLCLSKEFTTKLGGFLALDYTYLEIPFETNRVKIPNEGISHFNIKRIPSKNMVNVLDIVEVIHIDPVKEALTTIEILSLEDISYIMIDASMGNYCLHENTKVISISVEKE